MTDSEPNKETIETIQRRLGLSDGKMAAALGITRQTWRNWRTGRKCPEFAQNALQWLMELRRLSPSNDNLPERIRGTL
jgi:DNA-binding transcriptional regulator YiaG